MEDWAVLTPRAGRALLGFVAGWHSQANAITWAGGPEDMLVHLLPEVGVGIASWEQWMVRITDVAGALTARGWPSGVRAGLTLDVPTRCWPAMAGATGWKWRTARPRWSD